MLAVTVSMQIIRNSSSNTSIDSNSPSRGTVVACTWYCCGKSLVVVEVLMCAHIVKDAYLVVLIV